MFIFKIKNPISNKKFIFGGSTETKNYSFATVKYNKMCYNKPLFKGCLFIRVAYKKHALSCDQFITVLDSYNLFYASTLIILSDVSIGYRKYKLLSFRLFFVF